MGRLGRLFALILTAVIRVFFHTPIYLYQLATASPPTRTTPRPPELDDPKYGTHFTSSSGLHYVDTGAPDNMETYPTILFLHGFPEFFYSWRKQIPVLSAHARCVAVDMRGYNDSVAPVGVGSYGMGHLVGDIAGLVDEIGGPVVLVAHDWGGVVAWPFAHTHPDKVAKLVVMNAPHPKCFFPNLTWAQAKRSWYIAFFQIPFLPELMLAAGNMRFLKGSFRSRAMGVRNRDSFPEEDIDAYRYAHSRSGNLTAMLNYYRNLLIPPPRAIRTALNVPLQIETLVIWGRHDGALGTELLGGIEAHVPNVSVEIVDASHWVQIDAADQVNTLLLDFISH